MTLNQRHYRTLDKDEINRLQKLVEFENLARQKGFCRIAGVDEAGRGPLAGPVVASACILPEEARFAGINDSKLLTEARREAIYTELFAHEGVYIGVGIIDSRVIDEINILQATKRAMLEAIAQLTLLPDYVLVDAVALAFPSITFEVLIKGDQRSQSIAAASIVAKQTRDALMGRYHEEYPHYGFDEHKGYGTEKHLKALQTYGPCPIHRKSFEPVKSLCKMQT